MSTLTIAGNLTRDPELRNVNGGRSVVSFSIAENRRWADKDSGATQEAVTYLDVTAWGAMAEHVATSLRTGDRALVTGRLEQRSWEGTDGQLATPSTSSSPPRSQPACATPRPPSPGPSGPPPARTTT
jgi:single-strand DNA-binding protein